MTDIRIDGVISANIPVEGGKRLFDVTAIPITEGDFGKEGMWALVSAHLGMGEDAYISRGRYHDAENVDASIPSELWPGPKVTTLAVGAVPITSILTTPAADYLWMAVNDTVKRWDGDATIVTSKDFNLAVTDLAHWNGEVYAGLGADDFMQHMDTIVVGGPDTWAASEVNADKLHESVDRLWRSTKAPDPVAVSSVADDPLVGDDWSAPEWVGSQSIAITKMATLGTTLLVAKQDGLYGVDTDTERLTNLLPDIAGFANNLNGLALLSWGASAFLAHSKGLFQYKPGVSRTVGLERMKLNRSDITGYITAATVAGDAMWIAVFNGTDTYLLEGRYVEGELAWNPKVKLAGTECATMYTSSYANSRIYFDHGGDLGWIDLMDAFVDQTASLYRFAIAGSIRFGVTHCDSPRTPKKFHAIEVESIDCDEGNAWVPYIRLDRGEWRRLPPITSTGWQQVLIPRSFPTAKQIELRFDYEGTSDEVAARLRLPAVLRYTECPRAVRGFQVTMAVPQGDFWTTYMKLLDVLKSDDPFIAVDLPVIGESGLRLQLMQVMPSAAIGGNPRESAGYLSVVMREVV